jgi:uncharacterized protein (DUF1778 family)
MESINYILVNNKRFEYSLRKSSQEMTLVICEAAKIHQEFLNEDIPNLLMDLAHLILAEKEYQKKNTTLQIRLSVDEKRRVQSSALLKGKTVSEFVKEKVLG